MDLADLLKQDEPSLEINEQYLERLKTLPQALVVGEVQQIGQSLATVDSALARLGSSHQHDFVTSASQLAQMKDLLGEMKITSKNAAEKARKIPLPSSRAYETTRDALDNEIALYSQIDKIQELLQLPDLVQSCIVRGYYTAALDLAAFASRLKHRYPDLSVINGLSARIEGSIKSMTGILIRMLSETAHLPALIKAVSILRRTEPFKSATGMSSPRLQYLFLASRHQFLINQWATLEGAKSTPQLYLKRYVELFREHVFAAVTSFVTIFGQRTDQVGQFCRSVVEILVQALQKHSPELSTLERQSLWLQIAYCSHSLGRVGAEFWPLLPEGTVDAKELADAYSNQQEMARTAAAAALPEAGR